MVAVTRKLLLWSPRILGVLLALFLSLFALDSFGGGRSFVQALPGFLLHLAPVAVVALVLALSWRRPWVGGIAFLVLAGSYAFYALRAGHPGWILGISGPLGAVGALFLLDWRYRGRLGRPQG